MRYETPVADLLENATRGVESAWNEIVRRYSSLVLSVCRRYRITGADAEDVTGGVWLRLVAHLGAIREPEALPGWLATTTRNECLELLRHHARQIPSDTDIADIADCGVLGADEPLLARERRTALHRALAVLPDRDKDLLTLLFSDPPTPYAKISSTLGMPIGAIGPTRQRCLARVRRDPAIAALLPG